MKSTIAKTITIAGLLLLFQTLNGASFDYENFIKDLHEKSLEGKLNWFTCHAFSGKKEASEATEAPCSVTKRREYYLKGRIDDYGECLDSLYRHSAEIEIISSDNENESEIDASSNVVYFTKYSTNGDICAPVMYNLYDFLFEGAAYRGNVNRIKELFAKKKDLRVTDTDARTRIFYNAVLYLKNNKDKEEAYEIFELLLKAGFYIFEEQQPPMRGDYGKHYMNAMIRDLRALKILLKHDPEWLNKFSHKSNIFDEIFNYYGVDFEIANFVLDHGADPLMIFNGRNALDVVLSFMSSRVKLDGVLMQKCMDYSDRLRTEFGVTPNEKK